jgi:hypothetical protein
MSGLAIQPSQLFAADGAVGVQAVVGSPSGSPAGAFANWMGGKFTTTESKTVVALSRWAVTADTQTHTVKLWQDDGTELASVVIDGSGVSVAGWVDGVITPLTIPAGTYRVGGQEIGGGYLDNCFDHQAYATVVGMRFVSSCYGTILPTTTATYPSTDSNFLDHIYGPYGFRVL